jgi:hypothetical protein
LALHYTPAARTCGSFRAGCSGADREGNLPGGDQRRTGAVDAVLHGGAQGSHRDLVIIERADDMALDERDNAGTWVDEAADADGIHQAHVAGTHQDPSMGRVLSDADIGALLSSGTEINVCRAVRTAFHNGNNL